MRQNSPKVLNTICVVETNFCIETFNEWEYYECDFLNNPHRLLVYNCDHYEKYLLQFKNANDDETDFFAKTKGTRILFVKTSWQPEEIDEMSKDLSGCTVLSKISEMHNSKVRERTSLNASSQYISFSRNIYEKILVIEDKLSDYCSQVVCSRHSLGNGYSARIQFSKAVKSVTCMQEIEQTNFILYRSQVYSFRVRCESEKINIII